MPFPKDLDPFLLKVLIAKESSFRTNVKTKIAGSSATGLMQVLQTTLNRLEGIPKNKYVEVKNNFLELKLSDLTDPVINVAAGIRWLSHKYYLLLAEKRAKPDDVYSMIKYYHSWDKDGETYANEIFKLYKESNNSFGLYSK